MKFGQAIQLIREQAHMKAVWAECLDHLQEMKADEDGIQMEGGADEKVDEDYIDQGIAVLEGLIEACEIETAKLEALDVRPPESTDGQGDG